MVRTRSSFAKADKSLLPPRASSSSSLSSSLSSSRRRSHLRSGNDKKPTAIQKRASKAAPSVATADDSSSGSVGAAARATFLSGLDLGSHSVDILSLPDPPTPTDGSNAAAGAAAVAERRRRRRRQSSPIRIRPLRDVTNEDDGGELGAAVPPKSRIPIAYDEEDVVPRTSARKRRERKSLCHVPSPAESSLEISTVGNEEGARKGNAATRDDNSVKDGGDSSTYSVGVTDDRRRRKRRSLVPPSANELLLDGSETVDRTDQKRRKRRQSLVLPSDVEFNLTSDEEDEGSGIDENEHVQYLKNDQPNESSSLVGETEQYLAITTDSSADKIPPMKKSMGYQSQVDTSAVVRELVRDYCSLPPSKRCESKQAEDIERLSGYPITSSFQKETQKHGQRGDMNSNELTLDWSSSPGTMGETGEKTNHSSREGEYQSSTEAPLDKKRSSEATTLSTLESKRALLLQMGPVVDRMESRKKEEADATELATNCRIERSRSGKYRYFDNRNDQQVPPSEYKRRYLNMVQERRLVRMSSASEERSDRPGKDVMNAYACADRSKHCTSRYDAKDDIAMDQPDRQCSSDGSAPPEENINDKKKATSFPTSPRKAEGEEYGRCESCKNIEAENDAQKADEEIQHAPSSPQILLPLPSRDEASADPDIAAAEQRLWSAIDKALENYSREVLSIRASKKRNNGSAKEASF